MDKYLQMDQLIFHDIQTARMVTNVHRIGNLPGADGTRRLIRFDGLEQAILF